jgi:hypothetical protein
MKLLESIKIGNQVLKNSKRGSTDFDLTSSNKINSIGHTTGLIMLNVTSREEAEEWAFKDPFHMKILLFFSCHMLYAMYLHLCLCAQHMAISYKWFSKKCGIFYENHYDR